MVDGLIGYRVLQDNIRLIAKNIVKVEWLVEKYYKRLDQMFLLHLFRLEILYIHRKKLIYVSLQNCTCLFVQFSWATEYNEAMFANVQEERICHWKAASNQNRSNNI